MDWSAVEERIIQDDQNKWDRKTGGTELRVSETGRLTVNGSRAETGGYALSDLAAAQLCGKLKIPVEYYRRLPGPMQATVVNFDLGQLKDSRFLLRGKGDWIRAVLSGEYVVYNNTEIAETVQALLQDGDVAVKAFVLEETHLFIKIVSEEIVEPTSGLKAGIMIGNSEVGLGSVSVEPFVFRKACTNDLVIAQERSFRHPHVHLTAKELSYRMAIGISDAFKVASAALDAFLRTREELIPDPVQAIHKLAASRKLSQKFTDEVVSSFQLEPGYTRFGVINAFTHAAQKLSSLQRIEIERFAGTLVTAAL